MGMPRQFSAQRRVEDALQQQVHSQNYCSLTVQLNLASAPLRVGRVQSYSVVLLCAATIRGKHLQTGAATFMLHSRFLVAYTSTTLTSFSHAQGRENHFLQWDNNSNQLPLMPRW